MSELSFEIIKGTVKRVVFSSADTNFAVIEIENENGTETVVGNLSNVSVGEELELTGRFMVHPTYGQQFKAEALVKTLPSGSAAILKYLSSGVIKGIGPATAKKIVGLFKDDTFEVMEKEPERLIAVKGISRAKAMQISAEISKRRSLREICLRLAGYGISADDAVSALKVLGETAAEQIESNPYLLCNDGIGWDFEKADEIGKRLNIPDDNAERLCAGIMYVVKHNLLNGHTCLPKERVLKIACELLDCDTYLADDTCEILYERKILHEIIIGSVPFVSVTEFFEHESYIANRMALELSLSGNLKPVTEKELEKTGLKLGITFEQLQKSAIIKSLESSIFILTGGPGTGKTTAVNGIIEVMESRNMKVALAAPTGRAAKRLSELTGREAKTVHRLLEVGKSDDSKGHVFVRNEKNPLEADVVIVDEMSMVDVVLFDALLRALRLGTRLILVGDSDQLPSVGAGNVLRDLIDSGAFCCIRLQKVFRQALQSKIIVNAHNIINGQELELDCRDSDFFMLEQRTAQSALRLVTNLYCRRLPEAYGFSPADDIQVLCPSKKMELGTVNINNILQEQINPPFEDKPEIAFRGFVLRKGDKVMQTKNNYDIVWEDDQGNVGMGVFNGDVGVLEDIDVKNRELTVRFVDRVASYSGEQVAQLELAYAITVHKSQGSEFDCVILPLLDFPYQLKYRNLLYTAVTRAKKLLITVGSREVIKQMSLNDRKTLRYTALKHLLKNEI